MSKDTYDLKLGCYNCQHTWTKSFPFGKDVEEGVIQTYLHIGLQAICCPNCGSRKTHKIRK